MALIADGLNSTEISRRTGVPRGTVRYWRSSHAVLRGPDAGTECGARCEHRSRPAVFGDIYAYLLGQYLGDGSIDDLHRGVHRLRVACTATYVDIVNEVAAAVVVVSGKDVVGFTNAPGCVHVSSYWKHWPCVFPQHGPGMKHLRDVSLQDWQHQLVMTHAEDFLRGLFHSDGCRATNTTRVKTTGGEERVYRYTRYQFTNASADIMDACTDALEHLGIAWRPMGPRNISVARRRDVLALEEFIGPKS